MLISQAHQPPTDPPGILKDIIVEAEQALTRSRELGLIQLNPWAFLGRLRPAKLQAFLGYLENYNHTVSALNLLQDIFPDKFEPHADLSRFGWWAILAEIANFVAEVEWFEIDWQALNEAWDYWLGDPINDQGRHMAAFLTYVPVRLYGFDTQSILEYKPMHLLQVLLDSTAEVVNADILLEADLYDGLEGWSENDRKRVWSLLHQIEEDSGRYSDPVRWLPELGRWVCRRTGNPILDLKFNPRLNGPWFTWESDLEQLRAAWRRARPLIEQRRRLNDWYQRDQTRLGYLAKFLMEGVNSEQLDW